MNTKTRQIRLLIATLATSALLLPLKAQTPSDSTLQRSLTLQRAYVPETSQATKEFFNPLANRTPRQLHTLDFARTTYGLSMNARPQLFLPRENTMAPDYGSHHFYARLFGGYPLRVGGNVGGSFRAGETGTITLGVDHTSQMLEGRQGALNQAPTHNTHDTEAMVGYAHKIPESDRLLTMRVFGFSHAHSIFGHPKSALDPQDQYHPGDYVTDTPPMQTYYGGGITFDLSPTPLSSLSTWEYSVSAAIDYGSKDDWTDPTGEFRQLDELSDRAGALYARVGGGLTYGDKIYDFRFGVDAAYEINRVAIGGEIAGGRVPQIITMTPHLDYVIPTLQLRAGVKLQLPTIGSKSFVITPDVSLRWQMHDKASLLLSATGGTTMLSMRELYRLNRFAQAMSLGDGVETALYDISGGLELGSWYGFALDIKGGYASYTDFYDFGTELFEAPIPDGYEGERLAPVALFHLRNLGDVRRSYVSLGTRYVGPQGLSASLGVKYSHYSRPEREETRLDGEPVRETTVLSPSPIWDEVLGRPAVEIYARAAFSPLENVTASIDFTGIGGIKMEDVNAFIDSYGMIPEVYTLPFMPKLDLRLSYKVMDQLGLSLTVDNLLNQKMQRWSYYYSPGIGIYGTVTVEL